MSDKNDKKEFVSIIDSFRLNQEQIDNMTVMGNNEFMTVLFRNNKKAVEVIIQSVLNDQDIKVLEVYSQIEKGKLERKNARFDVLFQDQNENLYILEFQKLDQGNVSKRSLEYVSQLVTDQLPKGVKADDIKKIYVIFFTDFDAFGFGAPSYEIQYKIVSYDGFHQKIAEYDGLLPEKNSLEDEPVRIFVNTLEQDENTPLGRLCMDLTESDPEKVHNKHLRESIKFLKEDDEEGKREMSALLQQLVALETTDLREIADNERKLRLEAEKEKLIAEKAIEEAKRTAEEAKKAVEQAALNKKQNIRKLLLSDVSEDIIISSMGISKEELDRIKEELN